MASTILHLLFLCGAVTLAVSGPTRASQTFDISESINNFALKFHKVVAQEAGNTNVVTSPLAIQLLLSLYAAGTEGALRQELIDSLQLGDFQQVVQRFGSLSSNLSNYNPDTLTLASRIYTLSATEGVSPLNAEFLQTSRAYNAEVKELDFSNVDLAADTINAWAAEQSRQHIKKAVSADDLPPDTELALLNVIYFQSNWSTPFHAEETKEADFFVTKDTVVRKQMMHAERSFNYYDSKLLGARLLDLHYADGAFRMVVVLPNAVDGLAGVLQKLWEHGLAGSLRGVTDSQAVDIDLEIPKFEIEHKLDLNELLPQVGVSKIFKEPATKLLVGRRLVVKKALQKAFVKIDEQGTTATAFTGIFAVPDTLWMQSRPPVPFHVDRPFFFAILRDDVTVFTGTYVAA